MAETDSVNLVKKSYLAENTALLAYSTGRAGRVDGSIGLYRSSFALYDELLGQQKLSALDKRRFAIARIDCAELLIASGQVADARLNLVAAREIFADEKIAKESVAEIARLNALLAKTN
jgi:hypothetical protein